MDFKLTDWDLELLRSLGPIKVRGTIYFSKAQTLDLPQLEESGIIYATNVQTINLPQLQKSGFIDAYHAQTINLPQLKECGNIYTLKAKTIIIQNHLKHKLKGVPKDCIIKEPSSKVTLEQVYERMLWTSN